MWFRKFWLLIGSALVLAGCGGGSAHSGGTNSSRHSGGTNSSGAPATTNGVARKSPDAIVAGAERAIQGARSVHVVGMVVDSGIPVRLNLRLSAGHGGQGVISENGLGFRLISTGRVMYIQGSDAFWAHFGGAGAARLFHGKWLKVPVAGQFATLGKLATISGLVGQLLQRHGRLARGGSTTIAGQPAVGVVDRTRGGTLYVAATGQPYPLEIIKRGAGGGYVKLTEFNQPVSIVPPAKSINLPGARSG